MPSRALVVDANILVRAVLGRRVREVIETYAVSFFVPEVAFAEAEEMCLPSSSSAAAIRIRLSGSCASYAVWWN